jgi:hypothetical protein
MVDAASMSAELPSKPEDLVVFLIDDKSVSVSDIVHAAAFRDALRPAWVDLLRKLHREQIASEADMEEDEERVQAMADEFRYNHDLISAEETEAWFAARGLTMDDFHAYVTRRFWDEQLAEHEPPAPVDFAFASSEQRELLRIDVLISGLFERLALALSWRMSASRGPGSAEDKPGDTNEAERNRFVERAGMEPSAIEEWLVALGRDAAWFQDQLRMEAAYRAHCEDALTSEKRSRMLNSSRLPLTRLEVETVEFDRGEALNEAYLCVHEDGLPMEDLAKMGRYPYSRKEFLVEDLPEYWQRRFLAASEGTALEPEADDGVFQLCRLLRKQEPKIDDPSVLSRIDQRILEAHFADLSGQCVRWILR